MLLVLIALLAVHGQDVPSGAFRGAGKDGAKAKLDPNLSQAFNMFKTKTNRWDKLFAGNEARPKTEVARPSGFSRADVARLMGNRKLPSANVFGIKSVFNPHHLTRGQLTEIDMQEIRDKFVRTLKLERSDRRMPWLSNVTNARFVEMTEKSIRETNSESQTQLRSARFSTFVRMVRLHRQLEKQTKCNSRKSCAIADGKVLIEYKKFLAAVTNTTRTFDQLLHKAAPHRAEIMYKYQNDRRVGTEFLIEWSLNRNYLSVTISLISTILASVAVLYLGGLVLIGIFYLKVQQADGKKYLAVAGGLFLAALFRLIRSIIGFVGAGSATPAGIPMIVPVVLGSLVSCVVCVSLWYFLFLWVSAYCRVFLEGLPRSKIIRTSLKIAVIVLVVLLPVLTVLQSVLYHLKTSPLKGKFPLFMTPLTIFLMLFAVSGLIAISILYLKRFKYQEAEGEVVDRRHVTAAIRMLVICSIMWVVFAGGFIGTIYILANAMELAMDDKIDVTFGFLVGAMEMTSMIGFGVILTLLLFGDRCSCGQKKNKQAGGVEAGDIDTSPLLAETAGNPYRASTAPNGVPDAYDI
jgi:hypothetical protein